MKNPLNKRLPRELRGELPKYLIIFLFFVLCISAVSGFLVSDNSLQKANEESYDKFKIEDGYFEYKDLPSDEVLKKIEDEGKIKLFANFYKDEKVQSFKENDATLRVYANR